MSDGLVAMCAGYFVIFCVTCVHSNDSRLVAASAILLGDLEIAGSDLDRFLKLAGSKIE